MEIGETDPTRRRIYFTIYSSPDGTLVSAADTLGPFAPTVRVAVGDGSLVGAGGTFSHVSNEPRLHYYEASASEVVAGGFLLVVVSHATIQDAIAWDSVGQLFSAGETSARMLRLPLTIFSNNTLATGATATGSQLRSSVGGAALGNDAGSLVEIGHGAYYWQATAPIAAAAGRVLLEVDSPGFDVALTTTDVAPAVGGGAGPPPTITAVSPATDTAPGSVGGMPAAYGTARDAAINVLVETAGELALVQVTAAFLDGTLEVVYRAGVFAPGYAPGSTQIAASGSLLLAIRRDAGWPAGPFAGAAAISLLVDAANDGGGAASALLRYQMPLAHTTLPATSAASTPGAVDLFAEAYGLVVWQLR